jgi:acyl carrier protein
MKNKIGREEILTLVVSTLEIYCSDNDIIVDISKGEELKLFGGDSLLDSLGLVSLIVSIEEALEEQFNTSIVLADEKAMSRRTSPFSRVSYLVDYILELINID